MKKSIMEIAVLKSSLVTFIAAASIGFFSGVNAQDNNASAFKGFKGDKQSEIILEDWVCEYCPQSPLWEIQLDTHIGTLSDKDYYFGNYSGLDEDNLIYFSGDIKMQQDDGRYWKATFQNLGLDSAGLQSAYGVQGAYAIELDYQSIPVRKYDQLLTPFTAPGSSQLQLPTDWVQSGNATDFTPSDLFTQFSTGTDWDRLGLSFDLIANDHFDLNSSYRRLTKEGVREFSAAQILNATFLPFPVDQTTEDFSATLNYNDEQWFASVAVRLSRFNNDIDSVSYATPYLPLVAGSEISQISTAPDNTASKLSLNARYSYAPRSFAKLRYSIGKLTQDDSFIPYTTNPNLLSPLPQADLDGDVSTEDLALQLRHWFNSDWSLSAKYRDRERDNETEQILLQPVITDTYVATSLLNLPYDFSKTSSDVRLDYRLYRNQLLSVSYQSQEKTRNFQSVYKTTEDGFVAKYKATYGENLMVLVKGEQFTRDSSAPDLIDYLGVSENPLMQRFNVSEREQDKIFLQLFYSPLENFSMAISGYSSEQDYEKVEIGLTNNQQQNLNLDLSWNLSEKVDLSLFLQQEEIETELAGSADFSAPNWYANNLDEVSSYGFNIAFRKLMDSNLDLLFDFSRADADTQITLNQNNLDDPLPEVGSLWSQAEMKLKYRYSENLNLDFSYQYQEFESQDYAIDGIVPGDVTNLLTFGALSNDYDVNYWVLSIGYKFK